MKILGLGVSLILLSGCGVDVHSEPIQNLKHPIDRVESTHISTLSSKNCSINSVCMVDALMPNPQDFFENKFNGFSQNK